MKNSGIETASSATAGSEMPAPAAACPVGAPAPGVRSPADRILGDRTDAARPGLPARSTRERLRAATRPRRGRRRTRTSPANGAQIRCIFRKRRGDTPYHRLKARTKALGSE
ncbi:hypothetical protein mvi_45230 [Methylobacterium indicum]|uniref:Uncharacterized protein n=1 Tax=Methylobacterium indicum TaxID=1775910 RepID=A0A8H8WXL2_9HYPH|nr:hypothetical protein mvi_45230 [Methylobacterium indicum]